MATTLWHFGKKNYETREDSQAKEFNRGRTADKPSELPAKGWKDILYRVKSEVKNNQIGLISAAMAYYALLAFVPAITTIVLMYAWISDPGEISNHISKVGKFIPSELQEILRTQLTALSSKAQSTLGLSAITGLLFSLWSSSKVSKAIIVAMNIVHDEKEERGFFKLNLSALGLTFLGALLGVMAIFVVVGLPAFIKFFNLSGALETGVAASSWLVLLTIFSFFLSMIYRYAPDRDEPKWKWVSWGAAISAILWAAASLLFSWYASKFGNFNKTYGSLGAVIVLMMWLYISSYVILLGGEINAEMEHQTKKDTTKGPAKPMGSRNATMADTLGESAKKRVRTA